MTISATDDNRTIFGENLRICVARSGKTQREIADFIGVTSSTFNEWVKGKKYPRIEKIEMLAQYFGVTKAELIERQSHAEVGEKDSSLISNESGKQLYAADVLDIIIRLHTDPDFRNMIEDISALDETRLKALQQFLQAFGNK
jgi:transcriptional regulator with XRE-family HTH domain